jgi:hypothetical protein
MIASDTKFSSAKIASNTKSSLVISLAIKKMSPATLPVMSSAIQKKLAFSLNTYHDKIEEDQLQDVFCSNLKIITNITCFFEIDDGILYYIWTSQKKQ